jgi:hypothetical protein
MEDFEDTISEFLQAGLELYCGLVMVCLTCSGDVLMNTGGPFRQLMKIGTSFFKNAGYIGPEM